MMTNLFIFVGNHLWQSTLFALCVSALAVSLRGIPARTRFWLWHMALLKFLVPFSLLLALGSALAPQRTGAAQIQPAPFYEVDAVSQPFTFTLPALSAQAQTALHAHSLPIERILIIAAAVWAVGILIVVCSWMVSWRRVMAVLRNASTAADGVEFEILSRLRERMKMKAEVALLISDAAMELGIVGLWRSTLVWPRRISERLNEEQIEAVIAHELAHVRRYDNLTAALAMMGSAIFWFHPLVGWIKARMLATREAACDETVLLLGNEPEVYASSILRACEFSIESPLACVSGITGSDLKERVRRIMCGNPVRRLSRGAAALLTFLAAAVVLFPIGFGFLDAPRASAALLEDDKASSSLSFEVATIKETKDVASGRRSLMMAPGRFWTANIPLGEIIIFAYDAKSTSQISGYPDWVTSTHYDIEAKEDEATSAALMKMSQDERTRQIRLMVQALLAERFKLKVSHNVKELPVYALVIAKGGPKLTKSAGPQRTPDGKPVGRGFRMTGAGEIQSMNVPLDAFASGILSRMLETEGRVVVDKTGLEGNYDFKLKWTPERNAAGAGDPGGGANTPADQDAGPGLLTALEEQLGLKLESQKGSVEGLVVEHIEPPSPN